MTKATACARRVEKARSSDFAIVDSNNPGRRGVTTPITPVRRTTGTTGMSLRKRRDKPGGKIDQALAERLGGVFAGHCTQIGRHRPMSQRLTALSCGILEPNPRRVPKIWAI